MVCIHKRRLSAFSLLFCIYVSDYSFVSMFQITRLYLSFRFLLPLVASQYVLKRRTTRNVIKTITSVTRIKSFHNEFVFVFIRCLLELLQQFLRGSGFAVVLY